MVVKKPKLFSKANKIKLDLLSEQTNKIFAFLIFSVNNRKLKLHRFARKIC